MLPRNLVFQSPLVFVELVEQPRVGSILRIQVLNLVLDLFNLDVQFLQFGADLLQEAQVSRNLLFLQLDLFLLRRNLEVDVRL